MRDVRERKRKGDEKNAGEEKRGGGDPTGWVMCRCPPLRGRDTTNDGTGEFRGGGLEGKGKRWEKRGGCTRKSRTSREEERKEGRGENFRCPPDEGDEKEEEEEREGKKWGRFGEGGGVLGTG